MLSDKNQRFITLSLGLIFIRDKYFSIKGSLETTLETIFVE